MSWSMGDIVEASNHLPIFAREGYAGQNLLQCQVSSIKKSLLADPAAVVSPAGDAAEVALPALSCRWRDKGGTGGAAEILEQVGVLQQSC